MPDDSQPESKPQQSDLARVCMVAALLGFFLGALPFALGVLANATINFFTHRHC